MTFEEIKQQEHEYLMQTYARFDVALTRGKGATAVDINGKRYIDFTSGIGVNVLGYCDVGFASAISSQTRTITHTSNLYYSPVQVELAKKLCNATVFDKVFLCNSGAEANECAIKLARKYSFDKYGKGRHKIVSLLQSFHGRTLTTLSMTGQESLHDFFFPFTEGFSYSEANMESIEKAVDSETCAVAIELIQGEGGVIPLNENFVKSLAKFCKEKDILLIVDEVQTGVGRTGKLFCYEHYGLKPDILTAAKGLGGGLPIGACLCSAELGSVFSAGSHGSTFGGNPIACAGASYVLDQVNSYKFLSEVSRKGALIQRLLSDMSDVVSIRGKGLMIGIEIKGDARKIAEKCAENGLLILTAKTLLRMLPPLNITDDEIEAGLSILNKVLREYA
ncbi:MAG: aspartate aminotransferase family protein [Bacillota bacterium]|nr:aspartate aminotransferase family protein [Bacillota bacterium]